MSQRALIAGLLLSLLPSLAEGGITSVTKSTDLQFGRLVNLGAAGTIVLSSAGARTASGGVRLVSGGTVSAGAFTATGGNHSRYTITLPANNTVVISYRGSQIRLSNFTCSVPLTGNLPGKTMTFSVGATGTVSPNPTPGNYRGSFTVTVN